MNDRCNRLKNRWPIGFWGALVIGVLMSTAWMPVAASSESPEYETWTVQQAVEQALESPAVEERLQARVDSARAEEARDDVWPNPEVEYGREQIFAGPGEEVENTWSLSQRFPLSGRLNLMGEAARIRAESVEFETDTRRREMATEVRRAFFDVLQEQQRLDIYARAIDELEATQQLMERRVDAGESSSYELERLRRKRADLRSEEAAAEARLARHRSLLSGWLATDSDESQEAVIRASGQLLPDEPPSDSRLRDLVAEQPDIRAMERELEALGYDQRAASRWWIPDLTLRGGLQTETGGGDRSYGYVAGIGLSIPLWDRRQGERQSVAADRIEMNHQREFTEQTRVAEVLGIAREIRRLQRAYEDYGVDGVERAERILDTATSSYRNGEATILELVDAYRGQVDAELRRLELAAECRTSALELREHIGDATTSRTSSSERD